MDKDSQTDELTLLYQRARDEWDERLGSVISQLVVWRILAIVSMVVTSIAVIGIAYIGSQSKIQPYVFAMDGDKVVALQAAKLMPSYEKKRLEVSQLSNFIEHVRSVFTDLNAQRSYVIKAYSHLRSSDPAAIQVGKYLRETAPPHKRAETEVVTIKVDSVLPIGDDSNVYQVEWTENITDRKGNKKPSQRFKAAIEYYYEAPSDRQEFIRNPTGLWIKYFNVTEIY